MHRLTKTFALLSLSLLVLISACSKDLPDSFKAIPADTDMIVTLDAKATLAYAKATIPKVIPEELKSEAMNFDGLLQQALTMTGIDFKKLTNILVIGSAAAMDDFAIIAEGLSVTEMKGKKTGDHNGVAIHNLPGGVLYAELKGVGLATGRSEAMLKKVIDAFTGKGKRIEGTERGKLLVKLSKQEKDLDLMRFYLLTGKTPGMAAGMIPFKLNGGAMMLDLDKGAAAIIMSDKAGAEDIVSKVSMGLMALQAGLALGGIGGGKDMPADLDKDTLKSITSLLGKVKTNKKEGDVTISVHANLKPLLEKAMAIGVKQYQAEASAPMAMPPSMPAKPGADKKIAPTPPAPPTAGVQ